MFYFKIISALFSTAVVRSHIPIGFVHWCDQKVFSPWYHCQHLVSYFFKKVVTFFKRCEIISCCGFYGHSQMTSNSDHLFINILATNKLIFSKKIYIFISFSNFKSGFWFLCYWAVHILDQCFDWIACMIVFSPSIRVKLPEKYGLIWWHMGSIIKIHSLVCFKYLTLLLHGTMGPFLYFPQYFASKDRVRISVVRMRLFLT